MNIGSPIENKHVTKQVLDAVSGSNVSFTYTDSHATIYIPFVSAVTSSKYTLLLANVFNGNINVPVLGDISGTTSQLILTANSSGITIGQPSTSNSTTSNTFSGNVYPLTVTIPWI
jgi:hypothetical protein